MSGKQRWNVIEHVQIDLAPPQRLAAISRQPQPDLEALLLGRKPIGGQQHPDIHIALAMRPALRLAAEEVGTHDPGLRLPSEYRAQPLAHLHAGHGNTATDSVPCRRRFLFDTNARLEFPPRKCIRAACFENLPGGKEGFRVLSATDQA